MELVKRLHSINFMLSDPERTEKATSLFSSERGKETKWSEEEEEKQLSCKPIWVEALSDVRGKA